MNDTITTTIITEGFENWTFNNKVHFTEQSFDVGGKTHQVFSICYFPALLSDRKIESYTYRTRKAAERKLAQLTQFFHNPVTKVEA